MTKYHYLVLPLADVAPSLAPPAGPDSYLADDHTTRPLKDALSKGYRWVRSDGDHAIFEKVELSYPERVRRMLESQ